MRWMRAEDNGANQLAILMYTDDGETFNALMFTPSYPTLTFYDATNTQLYFSLEQPAKLINLLDPPVWPMRPCEWPTTLGVVVQNIERGPTADHAVHGALADQIQSAIARLHFQLRAFGNAMYAAEPSDDDQDEAEEAVSNLACLRVERM